MGENVLARGPRLLQTAGEQLEELCVYEESQAGCRPIIPWPACANAYWWQARITVVDVITNPRMTPFLATAREHGCAVVDGVEMLVQLARQIFQRWTGLTPEEKVFQRAVAEALGE